ncbi:MAG: YhcH/YjgK/YiaL family protein [Eubacteriales bacterium]
MIIDQLQNTSTYSNMSPLWKKAFDTALSLTKDTECGTYTIIEDELFYNVMEVTTNPSSDRDLEGHENYADLQVILDGDEVVLFTPLSNCTTTQDYDTSKDIAMYRTKQKLDSATITAGSFYVAFPQDAHMPSGRGSHNFVKKAVIKVKVPQNKPNER